jgi:hypothetical protein
LLLPGLVQVQTLLDRAVVHLLDKQDVLHAKVHLLLDTEADPIDTLCPRSFHQQAL